MAALSLWRARDSAGRNRDCARRRETGSEQAVCTRIVASVTARIASMLDATIAASARTRACSSRRPSRPTSASTAW